MEGLLRLVDIPSVERQLNRLILNLSEPACCE